MEGYGPTAFGELEVVLKIASVVTVISALRYELTIVVEDQEDKAQNLTRLSLFLNLFTSLVVLGIVSLTRVQIAQWFNLEDPNILFFVPAIIWLSGTTESLILWNNRKKNYSTISTNRMATSISSTTYKLSHFALNLIRGNGLILGHTLGALIGLAHMAYKLPFQVWNTSLSALRNAARKYHSFPLYSMPAALLNTLATTLPVFLISIYDGQEATGYFANAYKLTYLPMGMLSQALGQVFFERISRLKSDQQAAAGLSHSLINVLFFLPLIPVLAVALFGRHIAVIALGPDWLESGIYMEIIILFYFSMFLTSTFSSAFSTYNKLQVQLLYNGVFLLSTFLAMYLTYENGGSTRQALFWFASVGLILRLTIVNYFFYLFGRNIVLKTIVGVAIVAGLLLLAKLGLR